MKKNRDMINLLRKMSWPKVRNMAKILGSYHYSRVRGVPHISGMPIAVSIEPTTACNLRCPECPSGLRSFTRPTGTLSPMLFEKILKELAETTTWLTFYFQGEPFLHRNFTEMVALASKFGFFTSTSTNGHFFNDAIARETVSSGLDRLIISLDGVTQDTYESYRKTGSLAAVIEGTERIVRYKRTLRSATPHVIFQFLVLKTNEHQIPEVKALARQLGVDSVAFKTAQIYDYEKGSPLIPENDRYSRYRQLSDGTWTIKNGLLDHCWKMWHSCVITWDGKVVPCCFDKDAHHVMGDLSTQRFSSIWNGEAYNDFRAALLRSRKEIEMCRNCTEGTRVWAQQ